ncbi:precorrin-8X methylmutase [Methylobacterium sp. GXS13]|uniref:precorrin-8X methylmutase n=1 Tax=Methylobacterium sp. GXS13 TaxID=1730094 RepID=UPI00071B23C3|nr:precorrin-8X methylmutase [Methylobacterium sp. GXS13]KST59167.1 precorrin-8X methylmutase [Methylobacterium sp. GXS13]
MSASQNALRQAGSEPEATSRYEYIRDGAAIYARSFAMIRAEADLVRWSGAAERVVVRMIHACGMTDLPADVEMSDGFAEAGVAALQAGAPILCDVRMVADGVTRTRLPANNPVVCTLGDPRVPDLAKSLNTTRSAAAMELWREHLPGSIVAVDNAPTALFRLLELLDAGVKPPAAVIGIPVGFVGAAESKDALARDGRVPFVVVHGRRGGSAMTAAAVNALACEVE